MRNFSYLVIYLTLSLQTTIIAMKDGMNEIQAVVLAAGKSTRFGTHFNKLLMPLYGKPLITHITDIVRQCGMDTTVVLGHLREQVMQAITHRIPTVSYAYQEEQRGTGHALLCSRSSWHCDNILVLNGDMPLLTVALIEEMIAQHKNSDAAVTFVVAYPNTTRHAYGRVLTDNEFVRIVEAKDFTGDMNYNYPINAGIYLFKRSFLETHIDELQTQNAQKQLYVTDLIGIASGLNFGVTLVESSYDIVRGVNTMAEFVAVQHAMHERIMLQWLERGVYIEDCASTWIDSTVEIGAGTRIAPGVQLRGATVIGSQCVLSPYVVIEESKLGDRVVVHPYSVIRETHVADGTVVGPFVHLQGAEEAKPIRKMKKLRMPLSPSSSAYEL